jgi:hypothetical protein
MRQFDLIFTKISLKLHCNILNATGSPMLSDSLKKNIKLYLFQEVLTAIKKILTTLIYYTNEVEELTYKIDRILQLILILVQKKIINQLKFVDSNLNYSSSEAKWLLKNLETEDGELIKWVFEQLFISFVDENTLDLKYQALIISILETLLLKLADILTYLLLLELTTNRRITDNTIEVDTFFINTQKNNLYWNSYIKTNFLKPKSIYRGIYNLKIFTDNGFCTKLVYFPMLKLKEKKYLSTLQFIVLIYLEGIDFFYPKIKWSLKKVCSKLSSLL